MKERKAGSKMIKIIRGGRGTKERRRKKKEGEKRREEKENKVEESVRKFGMNSNYLYLFIFDSARLGYWESITSGMVPRL